MSKCRSCNIANKGYYNPGKHCHIIRDDICFFCRISKKWILHKASKDTIGIVLECGSCNNYIKYYKCKNSKIIDNSSLYKEEFYFDKFVVVKDNNKIYFFKIEDDYDKFICEVPIFDFSSREDLLKKIEIYTTFS